MRRSEAAVGALEEEHAIQHEVRRQRLQLPLHDVVQIVLALEACALLAPTIWGHEREALARGVAQLDLGDDEALRREGGDRAQMRQPPRGREERPAARAVPHMQAAHVAAGTAAAVFALLLLARTW